MTEIDVLLPVRGQLPWLDQCLNSLQELEPSFRLILIKHGDADIPEGQLSDFSDLLIVDVSQDATFSGALNCGIAAGDSPFIARLDSDDLCEPNRFRLQLDFLKSAELFVGVGSSATEIDAEGRSIGFRQGSGDSTRTLKGLRWRNVLIHPSMTMKRWAVEAAGGYRDDAELCEDYDLWLRMAAVGDLASLDMPLMQYRVHGNQTSRSRRIPKHARRAIGRSRIRLAKSRNESVNAMRIRHAFWSARHMYL